MTVKGNQLRRKLCCVFGALSLISFGAGLAAAAESGYPSRPITLIVPVPPGGSTDMGARLLAQFLEKELKQPVVVTNKPGAGGTVGAYALASAKTDGYTLGYLASSTANPELYTYFYSAPYSAADLKPICRVHIPPITIAVKGDAPWNSLKELVEYAKKNPGMKFGHIGKSTTQFVVMTTVSKAENLRLVDVPYDGDGTMIPALLGGHIPIATPVLYVVRSLMDSKKVKVLGVALQKRAPTAPEIPTLPELGYKLGFVPYFGIYAPKGTSDDIENRINEAVRKVLADKEFQAKNHAMEMPVEYEGGAALDKHIANYRASVEAFLKEEGFVKK